MWDIENEKELHSLKGHTYPVNGVSVTADGSIAVSASWDKTLKVWDIKNGKKLHSLEGHSGRVFGVCVMSDGRIAISASEDKTLKVWDIKNGKELVSFYADAILHCCAITNDHKSIIAGDSSGAVHFLELEGIADRT